MQATEKLDIWKYGKSSVMLSNEEWVPYEVLSRDYTCTKCGQHPTTGYNGLIHYSKCACGNTRTVERVTVEEVAHA